MPAPWSSVETSLVLPIAEVRAMWARARRWDVEAGGRFDARAASILIWSTSATAGESGEPIGCLYVEWRTPTDQEARIYLLEWDPAAGGTEAEVRRAIDVLRGITPT
jgi:hypothetical protein